MLIQLLVGALTSVINVFAHSLVMSLVIGVSRRQAAVFRHSRWSLPMVMSGVVCVLMAAHTIEAVIWAITYRVVGAVPEDTEFLYFAFVNFATLRLRRYYASCSLASPRPPHIHEWHSAVWLVHGGDLRGPRPRLTAN